MKIFTYEFETYIKGLVLCSWRGHKSSKWENTYWAPGHMGLPAKFCIRCGKKLKQKKMDYWVKSSRQTQLRIKRKEKK